MTEDDVVQPTMHYDRDQLRKDLNINLADLTGDMQKHAMLALHWAQKTVQAKRKLGQAERAVEIMTSMLHGIYRTQMKEEGIVKPTEAQLTAAINVDSRHRKATSLVIDLQATYDEARIGERMWDQRKDMLLQIARDAARETSGGMRVLVNQNAAEKRQALLDKMSQNAAAEPVSTDT